MVTLFYTITDAPFRFNTSEEFDTRADAVKAIEIMRKADEFSDFHIVEVESEEG
jgi:hypothetical protein